MESKTCSSMRFDEANKRKKDGLKSWTCMNIFNNKKTLLTNCKMNTYTSHDITTTATASTSVVESFCQLWSLNAPQYHQHMFGSKKLLLPLDSNNDVDNKEEDEQENQQPIEFQLAQNLCTSKHAHIKNNNYSWGWLVKGKSKANRKFKIHFEESIIRNKEFYDHLQQVTSKTDHNAVLSLARLAAATCFRPTTASSKPLLIRALSNHNQINIEDHNMSGPTGAITHKLSGSARLRLDPESLRAGAEVFVVTPSSKPELKWVTVYRKHKQLILSFRKKYMSGILTAMKEYKIVMIVEGNHGRTEGYFQLCLKTNDGIIMLLYRDEKQKMIWASTISNLLQVQDFCS